MAENNWQCAARAGCLGKVLEQFKKKCLHKNWPLHPNEYSAAENLLELTLTKV